MLRKDQQCSTGVLYQINDRENQRDYNEWQLRDTSNIGHNTQNKDAQNKNKNTTQKSKKMKNTDSTEKP